MQHEVGQGLGLVAVKVFLRTFRFVMMRLV